MHKNSFIFNSKKLPLAFLLSIVLLLVAELMVRYYSYHIIPASEYILDYKRNYLEAKNKLEYDGIILGDSRSLGIDTKMISDAIKKETGENFELYNFSFPIFGVRGYYVFLKKYIRSHKKPLVIFFETMPLSLTGNYNLVKKDLPTKLHRFCSLFRIKDYCDIVPFSFAAKTSIMKLQRISFLITYRRAIHRFLLNIFYKNISPILTGRVAIDNNGRAMFWIDRNVTLEEIKNSYEYKDDFFVDEDTLYWYKRFFSLAEDNDIEIAVFNTPLIKEVFEKRESDRINEYYKKAMNKLKSGYNNVALIKPLCKSYDKKYFFNSSHLNDKGNSLFSDELAKRIVSYLKIKGLIR